MDFTPLKFELPGFFPLQEKMRNLTSFFSFFFVHLFLIFLFLFSFSSLSLLYISSLFLFSSFLSHSRNYQPSFFTFGTQNQELAKLWLRHIQERMDKVFLLFLSLLFFFSLSFSFFLSLSFTFSLFFFLFSFSSHCSSITNRERYHHFFV